jgi:hypothetical protein
MRKTAIIIISLIFSGCAFSQRDTALYSIPYYKTVNAEIAWNINYLHQININDVETLRQSLQDRLALDAVMLYSVAKNNEIESHEKDRIISTLLLMSVENEKYPVQLWLKNEELMTIFNEVQILKPELLEDMRARNWSRPMWVD